MEPEEYRTANAPRYHRLDCVWGSGPESCLFLPHNHPVPEGRRRSLVPGSITLRPREALVPLDRVSEQFFNVTPCWPLQGAGRNKD
jgi:hypothetical protein